MVVKNSEYWVLNNLGWIWVLKFCPSLIDIELILSICHETVSEVFEFEICIRFFEQILIWSILETFIL